MSNHKLGPARNHACALCGERASNWHEKLPRSRGGKRDSFNAVPLCGSGTTGCHGWVEANPAAAEAEGWWVRGWFLHGRYVGPDEDYQRYYNGGVR